MKTHLSFFVYVLKVKLKSFSNMFDLLWFDWLLQFVCLWLGGKGFWLICFFAFLIFFGLLFQFILPQFLNFDPILFNLFFLSEYLSFNRSHFLPKLFIHSYLLIYMLADFLSLPQMNLVRLNDLK